MGFRRENCNRTNLIGVRYVDGITTFSDVTSNTSTPGNANLVLLFHFLKGAARTHVKQFGH